MTRTDWGPGEHIRLRLYRERKGWSQRGFAKETGIDQSVISRIESGDQKPAAITREYLRLWMLAHPVTDDDVARKPEKRGRKKHGEEGNARASHAG